jgi:hypothetical protein
MADPFLEAGDLFTRAFNAQELASRRQRTAQRAGMRSDSYENQMGSEPLEGPIPPQHGPYGTYEDAFTPTDDPTEDMKAELLRKAAAKQGPRPGVPTSAGNGHVTPDHFRR